MPASPADRPSQSASGARLAEQAVNLPNALTLLRIFLVPVLVTVLLTRKSVEGLLVGSAIFGVGVLTDYLDGYFARRRNQVTRLGILLDPVADKLLTTAALLSLVELNAVPAWTVLIVIGRELAVTGLRNLGAARGLLIPASPLGKGKMVSQVVAIFLLLLSRVEPRLEALAWTALWVMVAIALVSGVDYFRRFGWEVLRSSGRSESGPPGR